MNHPEPDTGFAESDAKGAFEHAATFERASNFALSLGPLEAQYQDLFAEVLEDGVITPEERVRLEKAADNLGLDPRRLLRLEEAMVASYETKNRVRVIERYEEPASLSPIDVAEAGDAGRTILQKRIQVLEARVRELEEELSNARAHINVEVDVSGFERVAEEASEDPEEHYRQVRRDPLKPEPYHRLFRIFDAREDADRRFAVAAALAALGQLNDAERDVYEKERPRGLATPKTSLTAEAYHDLLLHAEAEVLTGQIFGVIAPAVLVGRVTTLRRDNKLRKPDPATRQEPEKSTLTAVRALSWAAAILGLAPPAMFVEKERQVFYEHLPGVPPCTVVGAGALKGRTQLELAFLAGRHLSYYRQEHFIRTLFRSVPDLEELFLAALVVGSPSLPIAEGTKQRVLPIAKAIEPLLEPPQLDALRSHFLKFVEEGGRTNLQRWSGGVDKTACRAGLLISGDLSASLAILEAEEGKWGELARDLLMFSTGERYAKLRLQLGIAPPSPRV
jgi:hypothetical protein